MRNVDEKIVRYALKCERETEKAIAKNNLAQKILDNWKSVDPKKVDDNKIRVLNYEEGNNEDLKHLSVYKKLSDFKFYRDMGDSSMSLEAQGDNRKWYETYQFFFNKLKNRTMTKAEYHYFRRTSSKIIFDHIKKGMIKEEIYKETEQEIRKHLRKTLYPRISDKNLEKLIEIFGSQRLLEPGSPERGLVGSINYNAPKSINKFIEILKRYYKKKPEIIVNLRNATYKQEEKCFTGVINLVYSPKGCYNLQNEEDFKFHLGITISKILGEINKLNNQDIFEEFLERLEIND